METYVDETFPVHIRAFTDGFIKYAVHFAIVAFPIPEFNVNWGPKLAGPELSTTAGLIAATKPFKFLLSTSSQLSYVILCDSRCAGKKSTSLSPADQ